MNSRSSVFFALVLGSTVFAADKPADKAADKPADKPGAKSAEKSDRVQSDLIAPDKRRAVVDLAQHLTRPPTPEPLPADLAQPFNPPGFDLPDPVAPSPAPTAGGGGTGPRSDPGAPVVPQGPQPGEREKLDTLVTKLNPTGTILLGTRRLLSFGVKNVKIGDDFTVSTPNGQDYVLKLVAVDSTTFTVRLGNDEVTRSIDPKRK